MAFRFTGIPDRRIMATGPMLPRGVSASNALHAGPRPPPPRLAASDPATPAKEIAEVPV